MASRMAPYALGTIDPGTTTQLVIFDKDGTLTECDALFGPYMLLFVERLLDVGFFRPQDSQKQEEVLSALFSDDWIGYDRVAKKFGELSPVVRKTNNDVYDALVRFQREGYERFGLEKPCEDERLLPRLEEVLETNDAELRAVLFNEDLVEGCGDVRAVFETISAASNRDGAKIQIGVCTQDFRDMTTWAIQACLKKPSSAGQAGTMGDSAELSRYVGSMRCGDDADVAGSLKPSPVPLLKICEELKVEARCSIMVGDSVTDMQSGIRAGCKAVIFVESSGVKGEAVLDKLMADPSCAGKMIVMEKDSSASSSGSPQVSEAAVGDKVKFYVRRSIDDIMDLV